MNKQIYKLCRQYWRLDARAEKARGTCMNLAWYAVVDDIMTVFDELAIFGINPVTYPYLDKETPEGESILKTL